MHPVLKLAARVKPYWKRSLVALIFLTANVFIDLSIPRLIQRIIDQGIAQQNQQVVVTTALIMLGLSALSAIIAVGNNIFSVQVGERLARDLRDELFVKIQRFSFANLDRQQTGQLLVHLTSDTGAVQRLVQVFLRIGTRAPMLMVGSLILMVNTSPALAFKVSPLLLITAIVITFFVFKMEPLFDLVQQKLDRLNTVLQENVAGARLVKAFVRADHESRRFEIANDAFTGHSIRVMQFMATMFPALTLCVNIGVVVVIYAGGLQAIEGDLSIGQIVAFTNYLLTTMGPLGLMGMLANVWARGAVSARRIDDILEIVPAIQDCPDSKILPEPVQGRLVFERVSFHYSSDEPVLNEIDLVVESGQTLAILGATGAGKSTLVNLVPRFYDVTAGRIALDGIDIRHLARNDLLAHIAIVPQETILFSGSVRDNIRYGRPDASDDAVEQAARDAQAHDFVMDLPNGYDTHVAQRGVNLSGGQKQRIAIARALLMRPKILILDDSTSAVDVETETRIQNALKGYAHTRIVVAQRISTVLHADKIAVLDKGRIASVGTHAELMETCLIYREIYASQLGNGIELPGRTRSASP